MIAFNDKLMSFRLKFFKKQFVCVLFSVCSDRIFCLNNLHFILLITRITSAKMSANFIQFLLSGLAASLLENMLLVILLDR